MNQDIPDFQQEIIINPVQVHRHDLDPDHNYDEPDSPSEDHDIHPEQAIHSAPHHELMILPESEDQSELTSDLRSKEICERIRQEKIRQIGQKLQRQLSTINEISDQSINVNSIKNDDETQRVQQVLPQDTIMKSSVTSQRRKKKKRKKLTKSDTGQTFSQESFTEKPKKKKSKRNANMQQQNSVDEDIQQMRGYEYNFNIFKYLQDKIVPLDYKIVFCFFTFLVITNIVFNVLLTITYMNSVCPEQEMNNAMIYINQIFYAFGKLGLINLLFSEFTNTLPANSLVPLFNVFSMSSVYPILSMPLYTFNFEYCYQRNLFSRTQSIQIMITFDWTLAGTAFTVGCIYSWLEAHLSIERMHKLKKVLKWIFFICLSLVHSINLIMIMASFSYPMLIAMTLENLFFLYSLIAMIYLSIRKFCCTTRQQTFDEHLDKEERSEKDGDLKIKIGELTKAFSNLSTHEVQRTVAHPEEKQMKTDPDQLSQNHSFVSNHTYSMQPLHITPYNVQKMKQEIQIHQD